MNYAQRIIKLQKLLRRKKLDALLVSQPDNRRYLSGFTAVDHNIGESSGVLLVQAKGETYLLTDFRYRLQAEQDVEWARVTLYKRGLPALLKKLLPDLGIRRLGFESHYTMHETAKNMQRTLRTKKIETVALTGMVEKMRQVKDQDEIELIRQSVLLNEDVFSQVYPTISAGRTEIDVAIALETAMRKMGAESPSFGTVVASGDNSALPHAVPTAATISKNRPLTIDMGLVRNGYCSDMTRTFVPGKTDKRYRKLHRLVRRAQLAGMQAIRAGVTGKAVDKAARDIITAAGYGKYFGHSLGHGVGLAVHESPRISTQGKQKLKAGMIVTVEPGIYIPDWGGIRLENMILVQEDGFENLNSDTTWLDI